MAHRPSPGTLPCLFCGQAFRDSHLLTTHLDLSHDKWVEAVMVRLGLPSPPQYPIEEYRRALAEALASNPLFLPAN